MADGRGSQSLSLDAHAHTHTHTSSFRSSNPVLFHRSQAQMISFKDTKERVMDLKFLTLLHQGLCPKSVLHIFACVCVCVCSCQRAPQLVLVPELYIEHVQSFTVCVRIHVCEFQTLTPLPSPNCLSVTFIRSH